MSSNIKTKNLVYSFSKYDELPYQSSKMIDYSSNNQHVDMVNLDNTYNQCVDNDLFIAKKLMSKMDSSQLAGPKLFTSSNDIEQAPDGTKFFMSSSDSSVMQKRTLSFQESLTLCNSTAFGEVKLIHRVDAYSVVVCTSSKTYLVRSSDIDAGAQFVPSTTVKDENMDDVIITAAVSSGKFSQTLFAGHPAGQNPGLYYLDAAPGGYAFKQLLQIDRSDDICAMSVSDATSRAVFSTQNVVYQCTIHGNTAVSFKPLCSFSEIAGTGEVCALHARENDVIVFTTSGGIYKVSSSTVKGLEDAYIQQISEDDVVVYDMKDVLGVQYLATSKGICTFDGGQVHIIDLSFQSPVHSLGVDSSYNVWGADDAGHVLVLRSKDVLEKYADLPSGTIARSIHFIDDVKILAANNGLKYEHSHGQFEDVDLGEAVSDVHAVAGTSQDELVVFGKSSSGNLVAKRVRLHTTSVVSDYNYIYGLSSLSSFDDGMYNAEVAGMCNIGSKKYALVNFRSKSSSSDFYSSLESLDGSQSVYLGAKVEVHGVAQAYSEAYVFMTGNTVYRFYMEDGTLLSDVTTNPVDDYIVVDSQMLSNESILVTLSGEDFQIADIKVEHEDGALVMSKSSSIGIGCASNVAKHGDDFLAFVSNDGDVKLSAFSFANQMFQHEFDDITDEDDAGGDDPDAARSSYSQIYSIPGINVLNCLSYRLSNSVMYRRGDYWYTPNGNVSVVQSFINVNIDDDCDLEVMCQDTAEIPSSHGVSCIDQVYDLSSNTGTCYISSGTAVYTFQPSYLSSKVFDPSLPFDESVLDPANAECIKDEGVIQCALSSVKFFRDSNDQMELTSYEICSDYSLNRVFVDKWHDSYGKHAKSISTPVTVAGSAVRDALMLCRAFSSIYVLLRQEGTGDSYYVAKVVDGTGLVGVIPDIDGIGMGEPKSFIFDYYQSESAITSYLEGTTIDEVSIAGESFADYVTAIDDSEGEYSYETSHQTKADSPGGRMHIVFENSEVFFDILSSGEHSSLSTMSWIDDDADYAFTFNMTDSTIENALFTMNMTNQNMTFPVVYRLEGKDSLNELGMEKTLYGKDAPSYLSSSSYMSKDSDLSCVLFAKDGQVSAFTEESSSTPWFTQSIPSASMAVFPVQCSDKSFSEQQHLLYMLYNVASNTYQLYLAGAGMPSAPLAMYTTEHDVNVLNAASDKCYPAISYGPSVSTIRYESINDMTAQVDSAAAASQVASSISAIACDADDNFAFYAVADSTMFKFSLQQSSGTAAVVSSYPGMREIAFSSGIIGSTDYFGYAVVEDGSSLKPLAIYKQGDAVEIYPHQPAQSLICSSSLGALEYDGYKYTLFGSSTSSGAFQVQFAKVGDVSWMYKSTTASLPPGEAVKSIASTHDKSQIALQAQHGIYSCTFDGNDEHVSAVYSSPECTIGALKSYGDEDGCMYFTTQGNELLSSDDMSSWTSMLSAGTAPLSSELNAFEMASPYVLLLSKSSGPGAGLYYTFYDYTIDNNTAAFTAESAHYAYYSNQEAIDQINSSWMSSHVQDHHLLSSSEMALLNSYMDVDFQLSGFIGSYSSSGATNDYIEKVMTNSGEYDENVLVYSSNTANNSKWSQLKCTYIAKCWKSGLTELYVYLPTTGTHYIPHIEGAGLCEGHGEEVTVNGRKLVSNVKDNFTSIRMNIVSSYFTVSTLAENTIKPNSLPLRIYKDEEHPDDSNGQRFHSVICPSVAKEFSLDDAVLGYYTFNYYCFGSDAQAIKLSFYNESPRYTKKYKTITYKANGGALDGFPGMNSVTQRIYEGDDPVQMYWEVFTREGAFFSGWSQSPDDVEGDDAYKNGTSVSWDSMDKMSLTLYACWIQYIFTSDDTTMTISSEKAMDYSIAEITIDPNMTFSDNPPLGNKLVIEYGD